MGAPDTLSTNIAATGIPFMPAQQFGGVSNQQFAIGFSADADRLIGPQRRGSGERTAAWDNRLWTLQRF
jgi:hypothetical protein